MATEDDNVNSGALGTLLAVGACVTLGIALVVTALVRSEMNEELQKKEVGADQSFHDLVNEQSAKLNAPAAYVDRGKGTVSLPIERAMELTVSGLKKDPNSATPPAPPGAAGSGGSGGSSAAETAGSGGTGGSGGAGGTTEGEAKPPDEAIHAEAGKDDKKPEGDKPAGDKEKAEGKPDKKKEPKKAPAPAAPTKAAPAAPAPPTNGQ